MFQEIEKLFPLKSNITQEILDSSDSWDIRECNGAMTLKKALIEAGVDISSLDIHWGVRNGYVELKDEDETFIAIKTKEGYDFPGLTAPVEVTFEIGKK